MFATLAHPAKAYARVGIETAVETAAPHKLILMLFDGALLAISAASAHMRDKRIAEKGLNISRAIDIVANGLRASLDKDAGGELAARLDALYDYMCIRLAYANLKNDPAALKEVAGLLGELKGAWEEIADDPAVSSPTRKVA